MSTGAWIFAGFVLWAIVLVLLVRWVRSLPSHESDTVDRLIARAHRAQAASAEPVAVDWTNVAPPAPMPSPAAVASTIFEDDDMGIRTIGTPQPGDEPMKSEKQAATRVVARQLQADQGNVLSQLDILRATRHQREVGSVRVPPSLAAPIVIPGADDDVEKRD